MIKIETKPSKKEENSFWRNPRIITILGGLIVGMLLNYGVITSLLSSLFPLLFLQGTENPTIEITKYGFGIQDMEIKKGETVTFMNKDSIPHILTIGNVSHNFSFNSGEQFNFTFTLDGVYEIKDSTLETSMTITVPGPPQSQGPTNPTITITKHGFNTQNIDIWENAIVTFINKDSKPHTLKIKNAMDNNITLDPNEQFDFTFVYSGSYKVEDLTIEAYTTITVEAVW